MSPRSRLRLSTESSRSDREFADSQQFYQYTQHSPNTNRVFIDSKGQPHDPDFMSHTFPDQSAYKKRKMEAQKARRASMGRHDDDYNSDDELMSTTTRSAFAPQPQRTTNYNYYSSSYGSSSYSTPTPSWQHTSALLDDNDREEDDISPVSERFSLRGWKKRRDCTTVDGEDEKSRRVLRRRRRDLDEFEEADDEEEDRREDPEDCAPTCTEAFKQSWSSFVTSYKLGTHRLKRRMFPRKPDPQPAPTSPFLHEKLYGYGGP